VRSEAAQTGGVEVRPDLGDRRLPAELVDVLAELEELEASVAERREKVEHLHEPARERHERPEVGRVLREVRPAEVAHRRRQPVRLAVRDAAPGDRVADRELLDPELARRREPFAAAVSRAAARPRREHAERADPGCARRGHAQELPAAERAAIHLHRPLLLPAPLEARRGPRILMADAAGRRRYSVPSTSA
jgi:hypothetical protein